MPARGMRVLMPWLAALLLLGGAVGGAACVQSDDPAELPECAPPANAVSAELLAFLSKARAAHLQADLAETDDPDAAIAALDALVNGALPPGPRSPEAREVLADSLARTAELRSGLGRFEEAKRDVARGLELAAERTHYRGRLLEVLGVVESRLQKQLLADGDTAGAEAAKERALAALADAIDIQEEVINRTLLEDPELPLEK